MFRGTRGGDMPAGQGTRAAGGDGSGRIFPTHPRRRRRVRGSAGLPVRYRRGAQAKVLAPSGGTRGVLQGGECEYKW